MVGPDERRHALLKKISFCLNVMNSDVDNIQRLKYLFCSDYLIRCAVDDDEEIIGFDGSFVVGHIILGNAATPQSCSQGAEPCFNRTCLLPFSNGRD